MKSRKTSDIWTKSWIANFPVGVSLRHFLIVLIVIEYWLLNIDYGRNSSNIDEVVEV